MSIKLKKGKEVVEGAKWINWDRKEKNGIGASIEGRKERRNTREEWLFCCKRGEIPGKRPKLKATLRKSTTGAQRTTILQKGKNQTKKTGKTMSKNEEDWTKRGNGENCQKKRRGRR